MKRPVRFLVVVLLLLAIVAVAYTRAGEFRTEDSTLLEDVARFALLMVLLGVVGYALHLVGKSFLHVTRAYHHLRVIEPEYAKEVAEIESAEQAIAARQQAPKKWESCAKQLAAIYSGEFAAEVARLKRSAGRLSFPSGGGEGDDHEAK